MLSYRIFLKCLRGWTWLLQAFFLVLCLRFQVAAFREVYPDYLPTLVLVAGSMGLGAWRPAAALFAFTLSVPLLNGFSQTTLLKTAAPSVLVFSALWMGIAARNWRWSVDGRTVGLAYVRLWRGKQSDGTTVAMLIEILITGALLSLVWQIWRHRDMVELWPAFFIRPTFGFGEPFYFLTSAFLWLQGLYYFKILCSLTTPLYQWAKPASRVITATILCFLLIQLIWDVPNKEDALWKVYCSPFEDPHAMGSILVALLAFVMASSPGKDQPSNQRQSTIWPNAELVLCVIILIVLIAISNSRATWLATALILLLFTWLRVSRLWTTLMLAGILTLAVISTAMVREKAEPGGYFGRLISLVRLDNFEKKSPERLHLYYKGVGMIQDRPFTGFGIGSFYLTSRHFAKSGDPEAANPNFAHNTLLQLAAEQGLPIAGLFASLWGWGLWRGWRMGRPAVGGCLPEGAGRRKGNPPSLGFGAASPPSKSDDESLLHPANKMTKSGATLIESHRDKRVDRYTQFALTLALTAYLITQLTANSLNIYMSQQFFFWFLLAALLAASDSE